MDRSNDDYSYSESIDVAAAPQALYDLVTDIARTGEWSPVCRACWWRDGDGPRVGAWFRGRNEADGQVWETESQVEIADPGREFAWLVGGKYARWSFRFAPRDPRTTTVTESWQFLPGGEELFVERYAEAAQDRIALRIRQAREGIPATLAAIKRIAEAETGSAGGDG